MHKEILSDKQNIMLPLIKKFYSDFGLVGGTATALHLGHRRSIDFDLVSLKDLQSEKIKEEIKKFAGIENVMIDEKNELTLVTESVKLTFFKYPFKISFTVRFEDTINLPDLITLAAMKAYTLGRRAKWKDYVDLYFVLKQYSIIDLIEKAKSIFINEFNEKLFREQLSYFDDIDYSEKIDYIAGFAVSDEAVKEFLRNTSLQK